MSCEHNKRCGDCFSPAHVARLEKRIEALQAALFHRDQDDDGRTYLWCGNCDGDWNLGAPEKHHPDCPLHQKESEATSGTES